MPLLSLLTGRIDFSKLIIVLGSGDNAAAIHYGTFIMERINFLIISLVVFIMILQINKLEYIGRKEEV